MKLRKPILLILIALGLCAIGVSLYLQYGKPYLREMEVQKQDEKRIADLDALNASIRANLTAGSTSSPQASSTVSIGNANTVYISLPSATSTCADLELPSLPDGWSYHCAAPAALNNTDGTGWLPAALVLSSLPTDPLNSADTLNYYSFVTTSPESASSTATLQLRSGQATSTAPSNSSRPSQNATEGTAVQAQSSSAIGSGETQYVLTAVLDSKKYLTGKAQMDNGTDPIRYELGSSNSHHLWTTAQGLIGYWPLNDSGTNVIDISGNGNDGTVAGNDDFSAGEGLEFLGNNYAILNDSESINQLGKEKTNYTLILLIKDPGAKNQSITEKWSTSKTYPWALRINSKKIVFANYDGKTWNNASADEAILLDGKWHVIAAVRNSVPASLKIYVDGKLKDSGKDKSIGDISNKDAVAIGNRSAGQDNLFTGKLSDFMLLNAALTEANIQKISAALIAGTE